MRLARELAVFLACVAQAQRARANTEIVNFDVSLGPDAPPPQAAAWCVSSTASAAPTLCLRFSKPSTQACALADEPGAAVQRGARPARHADRGRVRAGRAALAACEQRARDRRGARAGIARNCSNSMTGLFFSEQQLQLLRPSWKTCAGRQRRWRQSRGSCERGRPDDRCTRRRH